MPNIDAQRRRRVRPLLLALVGAAALIALGGALALILAVVATLIVLGGDGGASLFSPFSFYLALTVVIPVSVLFGLALLRFLLRAFPLAASGRRQRVVITSGTTFIVISIAAAAWLIGSMAVYALQPLRDPTMPSEGGLSTWMAALLIAFFAAMIEAFVKVWRSLRPHS
jgi:hypothetical protein